jgi:hypothetical protein
MDKVTTCPRIGLGWRPVASVDEGSPEDLRKHLRKQKPLRDKGLVSSSGDPEINRGSFYLPPLLFFFFFSFHLIRNHLRISGRTTESPENQVVSLPEILPEMPRR